MLKYLAKSKSAFDITPREDTWFDLEAFPDHHLSTPLPPVARLLLTADGSMTQMLEALTLSKISMTIERQEIVVPDSEILELAGIKEGERALAREAWLTDGQRPLIYAHSLLLTTNDEEYSLSTIRDVRKPLGRMVRDDGIKTLRQGCRMGLVNSTDIAEHLGLPADTDFWGRYYRLRTDRALTGIIFELFSPELLE